MKNSILVPTDFSKNASKALKYAAAYAIPRKMKVILYHSFVPFESGFYSRSLSKSENKEHENEIMARMQKTSDSLSKENPSINVSVCVERGVAERNIPAYAAKNKTELIIMGTTGASGLKEKLIGSITSAVMRNATCPVLGVPAKYNYKEVKQIIFASDYVLQDIDVIKYLVKIAKINEAEILVKHFITGSITNAIEKQREENFNKLIKKFIRYKKLSVSCERVKDVQKSLEKLAQDAKYDLLAMISHKRIGFFSKLFHKSLTQQVSFHSRIPLLCIPVNSIDQMNKS